MAHVYAEREEDGFFGLGYAIGEDRLTQVLVWYLAVRGELAATFGKKTVRPGAEGEEAADAPGYFLTDAIASDRNALRYQVLATARRNFHHLPAQLQRNLNAYIQGLRAYLEAHPGRAPPWTPPLEPALPLAMFHLMVLEADGVCGERRRADARSSRGDLAPLSSNSIRPLPFAGSNAWAVGPRRTADSSVFFASDSHGPIEAYGTLFYPYRIKAGDLDVVAFDPAGSVMFLFGHSRHFAWGVTEAPRFVADCYRIATNPERPLEYTYDGSAMGISTVPYRIGVKGAPDETGTFEYTYHNGVPSPIVQRDGVNAYAVSYVAAERVGLTAGQYYRMAKARNFHQLEAALAHVDAYPANLIVAGADGTLLYVRPGRIPVRPPGVDATRTLDGNTSATAWRGVHTYADAVKLVNPSHGYVGNCNVSPDMMYPASPLHAQAYPPYFAFEAGQTNARQERLIEILETTSAMTLAGARATLMDETIPGARKWGPEIARISEEQPELVARQPPATRALLLELARFDGTFSKESRGALAHLEFRRVLTEKFGEGGHAITQAIASGSGITHSQQKLLLQALGTTAERMLEKYGRMDLTWGDVHRVGRGAIDLPIGGARLVAGAPASDDAPPRVEASLRALNFRPDRTGRRAKLIGGQRVPFLVHYSRSGVQSYAQTLFGVSDEPLSPHFSDQARLASDKSLRAIPLTEDALLRERAVRNTLTTRIR